MSADLAAEIERVVAGLDLGEPSARKGGRNPKWPYVPIIKADRGLSQTQQIRGLAYATRGKPSRAPATTLTPCAPGSPATSLTPVTAPCASTTACHGRSHDRRRPADTDAQMLVPDCGYTVRTTRKWIDVAVPRCPVHEVDMVVEAAK